MEEDVRWEGKSSAGRGKGEKEEVNGESIYLDGQHVRGFYYICLGVVLYDNVYMYHSNSQHTC